MIRKLISLGLIGSLILGATPCDSVANGIGSSSSISSPLFESTALTPYLKASRGNSIHGADAFAVHHSLPLELPTGHGSAVVAEPLQTRWFRPLFILAGITFLALLTLMGCSAAKKQWASSISAKDLALVHDAQKKNDVPALEDIINRTQTRAGRMWQLLYEAQQAQSKTVNNENHDSIEVAERTVAFDSVVEAIARLAVNAASGDPQKRVGLVHPDNWVSPLAAGEKQALESKSDGAFGLTLDVLREELLREEEAYRQLEEAANRYERAMPGLRGAAAVDMENVHREVRQALALFKKEVENEQNLLSSYQARLNERVGAKLTAANDEQFIGSHRYSALLAEVSEQAKAANHLSHEINKHLTIGKEYNREEDAQKASDQMDQLYPILDTLSKRFEALQAAQNTLPILRNDALVRFLNMGSSLDALVEAMENVGDSYSKTETAWDKFQPVHAIIKDLQTALDQAAQKEATSLQERINRELAAERIRTKSNADRIGQLVDEIRQVPGAAAASAELMEAIKGINFEDADHWKSVLVKGKVNPYTLKSEAAFAWTLGTLWNQLTHQEEAARQLQSILEKNTMPGMETVLQKTKAELALFQADLQNKRGLLNAEQQKLNARVSTIMSLDGQFKGSKDYHALLSELYGMANEAKTLADIVQSKIKDSPEKFQQADATDAYRTMNNLLDIMDRLFNRLDALDKALPKLPILHTSAVDNFYVGGQSLSKLNNYMGFPENPTYRQEFWKLYNYILPAINALHTTLEQDMIQESRWIQERIDRALEEERKHDPQFTPPSTGKPLGALLIFPKRALQAPILLLPRISPQHPSHERSLALSTAA